MKTTLRSNDLSCPSCVAKIESALAKTDGVNDAKVHFNSGRIVVEFDESNIDIDTLRDVVRGIGYETEVSPL